MWHTPAHDKAALRAELLQWEGILSRQELARASKEAELKLALRNDALREQLHADIADVSQNISAAHARIRFLKECI